MIDATTPLVLDVEEAAQVLLGNVVLRPGGIPRVANLLQARAKALRGEKKKGQPRTIKVRAGKGRGKSSEFVIKRERLEGR